MATQKSTPTIRDALLWAIEGEADPTSIQPIIDILCQQGWEVDNEKAGRIFCALDPFSSAYAPLNGRQQTKGQLKVAIEGAKAGFATNATPSTVPPAQSSVMPLPAQSSALPPTTQSSALPPEDQPAVLTKEQLEQSLEEKLEQSLDEKLEVRDKKMLAAMQNILAQRNQTDWSVLRHRWTALTTAVPPGKKVL